jgi:hypothetical protein
MGKDKGYSGDVLILGEGIFKHLETFQHLADVKIYWALYFRQKVNV